MESTSLRSLARRTKDGLKHSYDLCRVLRFWLFVRGLTPVLTRKFWEAWSFSDAVRVAVQYANKEVRSGCASVGCLTALHHLAPR